MHCLSRPQKTNTLQRCQKGTSDFFLKIKSAFPTWYGGNLSLRPLGFVACECFLRLGDAVHDLSGSQKASHMQTGQVQKSGEGEELRSQ